VGYRGGPVSSFYFRSRIEIFPRPSRALRRLRRRWAEIATVGFGVAWLALPRGSTLGLVFLLAGVAAGRAAVGKWRRDGNERN